MRLTRLVSLASVLTKIWDVPVAGDGSTAGSGRVLAVI